jgi:hypothetical protein
MRAGADPKYPELAFDLSSGCPKPPGSDLESSSSEPESEDEETAVGLLAKFSKPSASKPRRRGAKILNFSKGVLNVEGP